MFRPAHGKLYVPQSGCLEFIIGVLYVLQTHGFRQAVETLDREFGQQPGEVSEVVSRRPVRNTRFPRTGTKRQSFDPGFPNDLLRRLQQGST